MGFFEADGSRNPARSRRDANHRRLEFDRLEERALMISTLFLDFGDAFQGRHGLTGDG